MRRFAGKTSFWVPKAQPFYILLKIQADELNGNVVAQKEQTLDGQICLFIFIHSLKRLSESEF